MEVTSHRLATVEHYCLMGIPTAAKRITPNIDQNTTTICKKTTKP